jgi:hypothetical protein
MPDQQPPPVSKPCEEPFDLPAFAVSPELAAILLGLLLSTSPMRADQLSANHPENLAQPIGVIRLVSDQTARPAAQPLAGVEDRFRSKPHFRGRRTLQGASHRKTLAVRHHHPLCSLAAFRFSDAEPPFFAGAKLPSMKHSSQSKVCCSSRVWMNSRQSASHTPSSSQSLKRLQQVEALGRCSGKSLHRAPVLSTQRMPSRTSLSVQRGRPNGLRGGSSGPTRSQTVSVMNS